VTQPFGQGTVGLHHLTQSGSRRGPTELPATKQDYALADIPHSTNTFLKKQLIIFQEDTNFINNHQQPVNKAITALLTRHTSKNL